MAEEVLFIPIVILVIQNEDNKQSIRRREENPVLGGI
jgi:hypothetical protein